jgi:hypothetical protein
MKASPNNRPIRSRQTVSSAATETDTASDITIRNPTILVVGDEDRSLLRNLLDTSFARFAVIAASPRTAWELLQHGMIALVLFKHHDVIPAGLEPYAIIAGIKEIVGRATEHNHQLAEQEWLRVTKQYGMRPLPLAPAIDVKPTSGGVAPALNRSERNSLTRDSRRATRSVAWAISS